VDSLQMQYTAPHHAAIGCAAARGPHPASSHDHDMEHEPHGHRRQASKLAELVDRGNIDNALTAGCECKHNCLKSWGIDDVLPFRQQMSIRNEQERLAYLLHEILPHCKATISGRHSYVLVAPVNGKPQSFELCRSAFLIVLGVSSGKLDHALALQKLKLPVPEHGNTQRREQPMATLVESWWQEYRKDFCDKTGHDKFELPGFSVCKDALI
jgi:hypothetical protein